jgi:hypothetical protein
MESITKMIQTNRNLKNGIILGLSSLFCIVSASVVKKRNYFSFEEEGFVETFTAWEDIEYIANPDIVNYIWYKFKDTNTKWSFKMPVYINYVDSGKQTVPNFKDKKIKIKGDESHTIVVNKQYGTIIQRGTVYK